MVSDEDLGRRAAALDDSVVVCRIDGDADVPAGVFPGARVATIADLVAEADGDALGHVDAVLVVVGPTLGADRVHDAFDALDALDALDAFTVAVVPAGVEPESLRTVRRRADATLLAGDDGPAGTVRTFLEAVQRPGFVNLDLADARTALATGIAAVGTGSARTGGSPTADRDAPALAVDEAFGRLPEGVDPTGASAALVDVVVDPETSIAAATDAIAAVRERMDPDANVIWGGAVDEGAVDEAGVRIVVADVGYAPPLAGGDPCPRCGTPLSTYAFGTRETLSCDGCGYSGVAVRRD
ncbi:hypothetical protein DQW50_12240 [Halorubrum sp. 48-1-W]|uniref:zinc finger domain-containing protein n=1 Tax=Halorubrum sp. 48-1-W TaxID=2249761 RepID=UPI000DCB0447|nr:hypothetical protein [Halorubrum sp. 48-1-W]RAW44779.1 hypothetical protein DQW50_12240 [Halorubrum sp. 48-1-W]